MIQPLQGVKVISFTHFLQGPSAVQILADLGADVIKIEPPGGAYERTWSGMNAYRNGVSIFFLLANRNQRSISVDLKNEEGKEIVRRLVREADVIVENYRPGVLDKLGFGYEALKQINEKLIYCSCTGYGSDGPYRDKPGQDLLLQSMSGLAWLTAKKDGPPISAGTAVVDQHAAVLGAMGVLAALHERNRTGFGVKVDSNLFNAAIDLQIESFSYHINGFHLWESFDSGMSTKFHQSPYGSYRTKDGYITVSVNPIEKLRAAFGDEHFEGMTKEDQFTQRERFDRIFSDLMKTKTNAEWFEIFEKCDIWHSPVQNYDEVEQDPQVKWNRVIEEIDHPTGGAMRVINHPVRYNGEPPRIWKAPPAFAEHTFEVLKECGYTDEEIESLIASRAVVSKTDTNE
ncbi:CaiB/BaiF CoA transferase family protein [Paenibacillaceae bacterium WGS1546]|uniref:CaiB/BaiF CoA transferase family protein n=1 Tax=Cohnella sp. WGS1546 TaxID=3366810 RepID=UPI00372CFEA5